jgi:hypothetical protein
MKLKSLNEKIENLEKELNENNKKVESLESTLIQGIKPEEINNVL